MRRLIPLLAITLTFLLLLTSVGFAEPQSNPNGPWVESNQNISLSSLMTNQQLYDKLAQLQAESHGKMKLEIAGYSNAINFDIMEPLGNPLYAVKFGDADAKKKKVLITTQIHGNEPLGTEAAIELIQRLVSGGKEVDDILNNVTVWIMPRINPDGAMNQLPTGEWWPTRYSLQTWDPAKFGLSALTKAPWYYDSIGSERAQNNQGRVIYGIPGFDQNRDYNPNLDFRIETYPDKAKVEATLNNKATNNSMRGGFYVTPEARTVTKVFKELRPDVYFDLHHRGFNTVSDTDNRSVSIQVAAVVATQQYVDSFSGNTYQVAPEVLKLAKQVNVTGYESLQRGFSDFGAIQKYPDVDLPGTSLGAFALNNAAIMLIEVKGQTQTLGQKENGKLIQAMKTPVYAVLQSLANGSIYNVNPDLYDQIPVSANGISDPTP